MSEPTYIFAKTQHFSELERLQAIEQVFDPNSRRRIQATGITAHWRCLEVGAGAGSIAHWLAEIGGEVVAVDRDTRFLKHLESTAVEVIQGDIRQTLLQPNSFDLIHARYVLIHLPDFQAVLSKLLTLLKPRGWMVLEEPDFSAARAIVGEEVACQAMNRVNRAILQMFANKGMDAALGVKLPALVQKLGLQELSVENDVPLSQGGSGVASVMRMSTIQLAEQYIATGEVTYEDIEHYCRFSDDPNTWAIYYATVGVTTQKTVAQL